VEDVLRRYCRGTYVDNSKTRLPTWDGANLLSQPGVTGPISVTLQHIAGH